jgi:myo-inositol-1(or 4)-monophosphatase
MESIIDAFLNEVMRFMGEAGKIPMDAYCALNDVGTEQKADGSIVTEFDKRTEAFLTQELTDLLPGSQVLGEETAGASDNWRNSPLLNAMGAVWIIDPIDGTVPFSQKKPFGMLVGLRQQGQMVASFAYYPVTQEFLFTANNVSGCHRAEFHQGCVIGRARIHMPRLSLDQIQMDCTHDAVNLLGQETLNKFGQGLCAGKCIATILRRLVTQGDVAYMNGHWWSPWDFETTAMIARAAGAIVTHLDGTVPEATTSTTTANVLFTPHRDITDLVVQGYNRELAA